MNLISRSQNLHLIPSVSKGLDVEEYPCTLYVAFQILKGLAQFCNPCIYSAMSTIVTTVNDSTYRILIGHRLVEYHFNQTYRMRRVTAYVRFSTGIHSEQVLTSNQETGRKEIGVGKATARTSESVY